MFFRFSVIWKRYSLEITLWYRKANKLVISTELNLLTICLLEETKTNPIFINYQAPALTIKEDKWNPCNTINTNLFMISVNFTSSSSNSNPQNLILIQFHHHTTLQHVLPMTPVTVCLTVFRQFLWHIQCIINFQFFRTRNLWANFQFNSNCSPPTPPAQALSAWNVRLLLLPACEIWFNVSIW